MALLTGLRVPDFGRFSARPRGAALPGDLGAELIRLGRRAGLLRARPIERCARSAVIAALRAKAVV